MNIVDSIIVSFSMTKDPKDAVLIVGRKKPKKKAADIVNAFQGEEAIELYKRLTERKEKEE